MISVLISTVSILLTQPTEEAERHELVVVTVLRVVAALFLVFSTYCWVCVFVPRWRRGRWKGGKPIGTFGHAGWAIITAGWGLAIIVATMYPDDGPEAGRIIALIFLISYLGMAMGAHWDRKKHHDPS
jgi:hypothetical protein